MRDRLIQMFREYARETRRNKPANFIEDLADFILDKVVIVPLGETEKKASEFPENTRPTIYVPIECLHNYVNNAKFKVFNLKSLCANTGKKNNYKKFVKRFKKTIEYLPPELVVEIKKRV